MRAAATFKWVGLALLGILIAAGVAIAASRLASQQIGLASEPISAGDALAPARSAQTRRSGRGHTSRPATPAAPKTAAPAPSTAAPPTPAAPPSSGSDGEHGGGDGDD